MLVVMAESKSGVAVAVSEWWLSQLIQMVFLVVESVS